VATHSTVPDEVERGDKLIANDHLFGFRCVDLHIIIGCPGKYRGLKYDDIVLAEPVDGISSDSVVSSTNLCSSQAALRSSIRTINDRGPSRDPCGIVPQSVFQEEYS